ncbi:thioredoxin family protein [Microbacterium sp. P04]|uniref:thioredoxin family protein n=1 Tax=Microbacterium sp. P04 TaxID=3366947 RepID=UPI0037473D49
MAAEPEIHFELFTSSFCGACHQTRSVLARAQQLLPTLTVTEHDVAFEPDLAEERDIAATPTVLVRSANGEEILRASGVPTLDQVLTAAARALDSVPAER